MRARRLKFIDLFAGIGGIRLGFEKAGAECVWSNEYDKFCAITYRANFGYDDFEGADIRGIKSSEIPDYNILCAGFPCQPFSIAGVSKKKSLGKAHGFEDKTQGTLFHEIARIIEDRKPDAIFLENVKNLEGHDKGKTFSIIRETIEALGYSFYYKVIDAKAVVPQHRERIFIIGFHDTKLNFTFPDMPQLYPSVKTILEGKVPERYTLTDHLWQYLQNYAAKHQAAGNGFGYGLADLDKHTRTLSARYYKDGSEILIPQRGRNPRKLTPRECARLQGFPDDFKIPVSDTQAYRQFGNAVAVPVIELLAGEVIKTLTERPQRLTPYCVQMKMSFM